MTELKTLKDITIPEVLEETIFGNRLTERVVLVSFLKAEAIKWIKGDLALFEFGSTTWKFIIHFFNISEEDLK